MSALFDTGLFCRYFHGARLSLWSRPARDATRGGDWCEAFALREHLLAITVGDVCGKGPSAYDAMRALRDIIRAAALHERDLFEIMRCANKLACIERMAVPVTAIVAVLNTQQRMLTVLNAGHPRPLVHTNAGGTFVGRCPGGPPLGISEDNAWPLDSIAVPAGAMLVFYTDGIIERERNPIKGERDLCLAASHVYRFPYLNHANAIAQGLTGGDVALEDDAAILTVRTT